MPWQQQVANVGLELLPNGKPAYREVVITIPRQSGKTWLILMWEIHQAIAWAQVLGPQKIIYSAQDGQAARKMLIDEQVPILERHKADLGIKNVIRSYGMESVIWENGSRIDCLASTARSGHGRTVDLGIKDELFADHDFRRDQALVPAMSTRSYGQVVTASTAGDMDSIALNATVDAGRAAVTDGLRTGIAFFEWSASDDEDPADEATWWRCMPALGRTVEVEVIRHAYMTLAIDEFKRAFLNIPTATSIRVISKTAWDLVNHPDVVADNPACVALDVNSDRSAAAIVAATPRAVEVVDYRLGLDWVVERCEQVTKQFRAPLAFDTNGPAGRFRDELLAHDVPIIELKPQDMVRAAGLFYDSVLAQRVKIRRADELDLAIAGAAKRTVGDAWTWGRRNSSTDISPLVAATIALATAQDTGVSIYEGRGLVVL